MIKMFLLFSHNLTEDQVVEAQQKFKVEKFIEFPEDIRKLWANIPPEGDINTESLKKIKIFIENNKSDRDYVLIQGDFGATYMMVNWCFDNNLIPIYATTKRVYTSEETADGSIINKHTFKHVNFRLYRKN